MGTIHNALLDETFDVFENCPEDGFQVLHQKRRREAAAKVNINVILEAPVGTAQRLDSHGRGMRKIPGASFAYI
jgi:hypothetical protein